MIDDLGMVNDLVPVPAVREMPAPIEIDLTELLAVSQDNWRDVTPYEDNREVSIDVDLLHTDLVSANESLRELVELGKAEAYAPVIAGEAKEEGPPVDASISSKSRNETDTSSRNKGGSSSSASSRSGGDIDVKKAITSIGDRFYNPTLLIDDAFNLLNKGLNAIFSGGGGGDKSKTKTKTKTTVETGTESTLIADTVQSDVFEDVAAVETEPATPAMLPAPEENVVFEDVAAVENPPSDLFAGQFMDVEAVEVGEDEGTVAGPDVQKDFLESSIVANEAVDETFNRPERSKFVSHMAESITTENRKSSSGGLGSALMLGLAAILAVALAPVLEKVMDAVNKLVDFFVEKFWPVVEPLFRKMAEVFVSFLTGLGSYAEKLGRTLGEVFVTVLEIAKEVLQTFKEIFVENKESIKSIIKGLFDIVNTLVGGVLEGIQGFFDDPGEFLEDVITTLGMTIAVAFQQLGEIGKAAAGALTGTVSELGTGMVGAFFDIAGKVKTGIQDMTGWGADEETQEALRQKNLARINAETEEIKVRSFERWTKAAGGFLQALSIDEMQVTAGTVYILPGALNTGLDVPDAYQKAAESIASAGGGDYSSNVSIVNSIRDNPSPLPSDAVRVW